MLKLTTREFIEKAKAVHGDTFDYSETEYLGARTKCTVVCKKHGPFRIVPYAHVGARQGCWSCRNEAIGNALRDSVPDLIAKCEAVWDGRYDYSQVTKHPGNKLKMPVVCKEHGVFEVSPNNHLRGRGCPRCKKSGYRTNFPGYIYILTSENTTKIGITNRSPENRAMEVTKSSGKQFKVLYSKHFEDGSIPLKLETELLKHMRENYEAAQEKHDGFTESFTGVDNAELIRKLVQELSNLIQ